MSFKRIIALIGAIIAVVEGLIMLGFGLLPAIGNSLIEAVLDVTLLTVGSAPFVYLWVIRPVQAEHLREGVVKQALTEILQVAVQPISLKEMLGRILGTLTELPWMDSEQEASLFVTDDMGISTMIAQRNVSPLRMATCGTVAKGNCRCGQAVESGESSIGFCPDVPAEAEAAATDGGKRHVIPLRMAGESVGVLSICLHGKRTLSDTEQEFMDSVTQTLAEIIDKDRTQKRLAHGETLQAIMDHAPIGIFQTNTEGCPRFVNETLCRELGRSMDEVMSVKSVGDLFDDQVRAEFSLVGRRGEGSSRQRATYSSLEVADWGVRDFKVTRVSIRGERGVTGFVGLVEDITETRRLTDKIAYQATHDALTGLLNRTAFEQKLDQVCHTIDSRDTPHAVCFIDLDEFKVVNDTCGHEAGDELLRQITALYGNQMRRTEAVSTPEGEWLEPALARLGGDEFGLLLYNCEESAALSVAERLVDITKSFRFAYSDQVFSIGCSIGITQVSTSSEGAGQVLKEADAACYLSKNRGRGRVCTYRPDDQDLQRRQGAMNWVPRITRALEDDRFELVYQPISPLQEQENGDRFEVLLRYRDDDGTLLPPGAFMSAAERYQLMPRVDRWVIEHTLAELTEYYCAGSEQILISASINLSGQTLGEEWLLDYICEQLEGCDIRPEQICFEITETAAIANLDAAHHLISKLSDIGCRFALDDFGSGLSSFSYLKEMPVDSLKIDGSLVKDIADDPVGQAMVKSINQVGHTMGLKTVAEWVETEAVAQVLTKLGVDYAQGYHLGRPGPLDELGMVLKQRQSAS